MKSNPYKKQAMGASFRDRVEKFEKYYNDPEQFNKIFTELGFRYVEDDCYGFCPECEQMLKGEAYQEIKESWDGFYS